MIELADQEGTSTDPGSIELDHLRCFAAVGDELHFRRAAARLGIPQSTLSNRIARLERQLGVQLIARNRRRVALTRAGAVLYGGTRTLLAEADDLMTRTRLAGGVSSHGVRVGHDAASAALATQVLLAIQRDHPGVWLSARRVEPPEQADALVSGTIDVGLAAPSWPVDGDGPAAGRPVPARGTDRGILPEILLCWRRGDTRPVVRLTLDTARRYLSRASAGAPPGRDAAGAGGEVSALGAARPAPAPRPRQRSAP